VNRRTPSPTLPTRGREIKARERLAVIGTGVIGSGWVARALARGLDVSAWDPAPGAEARLRAAVANAWPALRRVGLAKGASPRRLDFASDLSSAVRNADFVQESVPEEERLKRSLLAEIDAVALPHVVIASSSSGLLPTRLQGRCGHPERVLIGHPFNPVYLLPLVEVIAGKRTTRTAVKRADAFYRKLGMRPLRVQHEIAGYISDRLQEALWREALHLVADGIATTQEIDDAIIYGPGLRWAFMGTFLAFHLAGGDGGMQHMLEQFGPALKLPWTKLRAPDLTAELARRVVDGAKSQADGRSIKELERWRDDQLIRIMAVTGA
jgi:carnitine 3-dehydrogenase